MRLVERLIPDEDADPKHIRSWRKTIGIMVFCLSLICGFTVGAMFEGYPVLGTLVWSRDLSISVQSQLSRTKEQVHRLEEMVKKQSATSDLLLAKIADEQISFLLRRRCKARDSEEFDYLGKEAGKYIEEWETIRQKNYRVPSCQDLQFREVNGR